MSHVEQPSAEHNFKYRISPVAGPVIDKQGEGRFFQEFIHTTASSRGVQACSPRKKLKSEASNKVFWIIFRPVFSVNEKERNSIDL